MTSGKAREAFAIDKEPDKLRDRYGRNRWGQCVLLARRLVEAGVRLVHVQWPREPGDNAVDNPLWDTHAQNAERVEDVLCPMFDLGFTALIEDLDQRGLLGRDAGRRASASSAARPRSTATAAAITGGRCSAARFAGAGIAGGQVYGSSDKDGAYPATDKVEPPDFTATIFHLLGINRRQHVRRPRRARAPPDARPAALQAAGHRAGDARALPVHRRHQPRAAVRREAVAARSRLHHRRRR